MTGLPTIPELVRRPDTVYVDVSPHEDYQQHHLWSAISMPLDQVPIRSFELMRWSGLPIVLYCRNGLRSRMAVQYLVSSGFSNVYDGGCLHQLEAILHS